MMSFNMGIDMWICSCLVMGCNFPCQKVTKKLQDLIKSQKRHTKAANWKRGIGCTWKI